MFLYPELKIAYKFFKSKNKDTFISIISLFSIIGIALGVATLITVMSIMKGYEVELISRLQGINGDLSIIPYNSEEALSIQKKADSIQYVEYTIGQITGQGLLTNGKDSFGVMVKAMDETDILKKRLLVNNILFGSVNTFNLDSIILGVDLAALLGVDVGEEVKFISPNGSNTLMGFIPKFKTLTVSGIFDVGMYEHNMGTVFIHLDTAKALFQKQDIDDIEITIDKFEHVSFVVDQIKKNIAYDYPITIKSVADSNKALQEALKTERIVMYFILTLMILVAAFNIISSLVILVKDKNKNIAILKTFGMSNKSIAGIFVIAGMIIGAIGTLSGGIIGLLFTYNIESIKAFIESFYGSKLFDPIIYYLTKLPVEVDLTNILFIIITALGLSILSTLYPAIRAAKIEPAKTLRNE